MKDGTACDKRTLTIGDEEGISIQVTLWRESCESQPYEAGQVIAFRSCRVSDFNGKSLNASSPADIIMSPRHPRAMQLASWQKGTTLSTIASNARSLSQRNEGASRD